jgi:hypothetical protein
MDSKSNLNLPKTPERPNVDDPNKGEPAVKDRTERIADNLANKAAEREHEYDKQQPPFNK